MCLATFPSTSSMPEVESNRMVTLALPQSGWLSARSCALARRRCLAVGAVAARMVTMGLLDRLGPRYTPSPVPLEGVRGIWTAANTRGGVALAGGQAVLTDTHLVFSPWDLDKTRTWLFKLLGTAGAPGWVGKIDELITKSRLLEPVAVPLAEIERVEVLNRASLLKPPTARLHLRDGRHFDLGLLANARAPNLSGANNEALDHFLLLLGKPRPQA